MEFQEVCWSSWFKNPFKSNGYLKRNNQSKRHTSPSPNRRKKNIQTSWGGCRHEGEREKEMVATWGSEVLAAAWGCEVAGGVRSAWWLAVWDRHGGWHGGWQQLKGMSGVRKIKSESEERERKVAVEVKWIYIYIYIYVGNKNPNGILVNIGGAG